MKNLISLSVVVPVYNEIENLPVLANRLVAAMDKLKVDSWEVILVDDGSTDGSARWIVRHGKADDRFRGVLFEKNCGQSAALEAGFKSARYSVVGTLDADLQNDPFDFGILLEHLKDNIGVVCGIRVNRHDSKSKRFASKIANWIRNKLTNESITDTGCSLKVYRKEALDKIKLFTGMHRFLPTLIKMEGYQAVEVPVGHHPRYAGTSKYSTFKRGWTAFFDLLAVRWMQRRKFHYRLKEHTDDNSNLAGSLNERTHRSSD